MVAAKFYDDKHFSHADFAKLGGLSKLELSLLEVEFVQTIGFKLHVERGLFEGYSREILDQNNY